MNADIASMNASLGCHHECSAKISTEDAFSGYVMIILGALMVTVVIVIVFGNALVIFSFKVDRSLRRQSNYYFLNLAISDFLVGAVCIPLYIPYILTGRWTLGRGLCKLWLLLDYLLCTASVFSIVLISYDRFLSVTKAVAYRAQQGTSSSGALTKMMVVWLLAFLLYGPAIIFWEFIVGGSTVPDDECFAEFYYTWYFLLCASTFEFFSPFVSVTFFNLRIYQHIHKRSKRRNRWRATQGVESVGRELRPQQPGCRGFPEMAEVLNITSICPQAKPLPSNSTPTHGATTSSLSLFRDKKVAKSLAVIVCVFGVCWAPYTLLMIIRAACRGRCVGYLWYEITFWLLWLNSAINPFLYPLCHHSFRRAFGKVLCHGRQALQPRPQPV